MKSSVAIVLIVLGCVMILAPAIFQHLLQAQLVEVLAARNVSDVSLGKESMGSAYKFSCWVLGIAMIAVGVFRSRGSGD